jgi:protein required for attachment to host cells
MKPATTWILVADGASARVFDFHPGERRITLVHEMSSEVARMKSSEIFSDNEGRRSDKGPNQRSTVGPADAQRHAKGEFGRDVAAWLDKAAAENRYERLILVAAPQMLGDLRGMLSKPATQKVTKEVAKDLTRLEERELTARLDDVV